MRIDECFEHALVRARLIGHVVLQAIRRNQLARPGCSLLHVVRVENLRILSSVLSLAQVVVELRHLDGLVHEPLAILINSEERHVAHRGRARVEVVQHLGVADGFDYAARPVSHDEAVAGPVQLLAAEVLHVGDEVVAHRLVVLVVAAR